MERVFPSRREMGHRLPRSLHFVAGAPQTARKKKPATPVGMTEAEKRRAARHGRRALRKKGGLPQAGRPFV